MVDNKILIIDDDLRLLSSLQRSLGRDYEITFAASPLAAQDLLSKTTFAVVISDMQMPGMSGIELLCQIKENHPDTVRILFTGHADQQTAVNAINQGEIFRFLVKPCAIDQLTKALNDALRQHQLITAERELLEKTLLKTVQTLAQILAMMRPAAQQRANRLKLICCQLAKALNQPDIWFFEMTALLSHIGCLNVPEGHLNSYLTNLPLSDEEIALLESHPAMAEELLRQIPRLEEVARAIGLQTQANSSFETTTDGDIEERTKLAAQILHVALEFDRLSYYQRDSFSKIILHLKSHQDDFNLMIVSRMIKPKSLVKDHVQLQIEAKDLFLNMVLMENIYSKSGVMLVAKEQELTEFMLIGIRNYAKNIGVMEPFAVMAPAEFALEYQHHAKGESHAK